MVYVDGRMGGLKPTPLQIIQSPQNKIDCRWGLPPIIQPSQALCQEDDPRGLLLRGHQNCPPLLGILADLRHQCRNPIEFLFPAQALYKFQAQRLAINIALKIQ